MSMHAADGLELLIWWTDEADCRAIGEPGEDPPVPPGVPEYIRDEYESRYGRNGRGRLWVPDDIAFEAVAWDEGKPAARAIGHGSHAGIVFRRADLAAVAGLPGFVTTTGLDFLEKDR